MVLKILFHVRRRRLVPPEWGVSPVEWRGAAPGGCRRSVLETGCLLLVLAAMGVSVAFGFETAVTPNASPEAQSLLAYFSDIYGKKILSGQQEGWRGTNELGFELAYITNTTGKLPAVLGLDLAGVTRAENSPRQKWRHAAAEHAIDWYVRKHGIVTLCWHWSPPIGERSVYAKDTSFDLQRAVTEGTEEHTAALRDLDAIAGELTLLRDARVPVLWRPLHEANGRWFWWGAQGPEPFKKMWRLMFERFTTRHKLNNLIWVFSPGAATDLADWYPGDEYVDIIGQDHYPMDGNNGPAKEVFDELVAFGHGNKLVALSENGPIPDPDRLVGEKAGWLFFTTWSGRTLTERNSNEQLSKVYHHPYVLNLGDLPNLRGYPFQVAGKAVKLGFPSRPIDLAIGSLGRQPVTVAVQDAEGRTVRSGGYTVTLALGANPGRGSLSGALTAATVNGIATFPDLKIDKPGNGIRLTASAGGLSNAASPPFSVGPGAGILREWWTDLAGRSLADLADLSSPPAGREVLGKALEVPVNTVSNYGARFRGFLLPPVTGSYVFWVASEVTSELWLGTNQTAAAKVRIIEVTGRTPYSKWPHTHEAQSVPVDLVAGKRYYIEVLQKPGNNATQLSVRWRLPNGVEERPIPGTRLAPPGADLE
jgi:mannan endo-1,4-beta-mannosidase